MGVQAAPAAKPGRQAGAPASVTAVGRKKPFPKRQETQTTNDRFVQRSALIPIPGLPALIQRDLRSFGLSWGVAVPTTAGMVGVIGASSYRAAQFNVLSILTYYAITVGVNRKFGLQAQPFEPVNSPDSPAESAVLQKRFRN